MKDNEKSIHIMVHDKRQNGVNNITCRMVMTKFDLVSVAHKPHIMRT